MKTTYTIAFAVVLISGCNTTPRYQAHFGEAARATLESQIVHDNPVGGPQQVDGQITNSVIDRYQKSYATPPQPVNVFNIGVGSN